MSFSQTRERQTLTAKSRQTFEKPMAALVILDQIKGSTLADECEPSQPKNNNEPVQNITKEGAVVRMETYDTQGLVVQEDVVMCIHTSHVSPCVQSPACTENISRAKKNTPQPSGWYTVRSAADVLARAAVTNPLKTNAALFLLARGAKTLEAQFGSFSPAQHRNIFDQWRSQNEHFLSKLDDFLNFMTAYGKVKKLLGSDIVPQLWAEVRDGPFSSAADPFDNPEQKALVALCQRLQTHWGTAPFPLSCRVVARLLGHPTHTTAASWLSGLCSAKVLVLVEPGKRPKASSYRYIGGTPPP
ncbi:MAG: hypothetical protein EXS36_12885 [Pedosphaera sp.]|nr:hypothetical protein [Pedosphaera sp.]